MAIDDVVSGIANQITSGGTLTIRPAAGDEWLVTALFFEDDGNIRAAADTGKIQVGVLGGNTVKSVNISEWGLRSFNELVTNAEYLTLREDSAATRQIGFSAIKTKE